jgi:serine phosphatase RsbU (regulator of sigma subunit)
MGDLFAVQGQMHTAGKFLKRSYQLADSINALNSKMRVANRIYEHYKKMGAPQEALPWLERFVRHKDSLYNKQRQKALGRQEARFTWKQKLLRQKKEEEKQDAIQRTIIYAVSGGLLLVIAFLGLLYNRFRVTQHQRDTIDRQKKAIDTAYEKLHTKNRELRDSMNYAQRIQKATFKARIYLEQTFPGNYFILHQPKEAVSGDFYWAYQEGNRFFDDSYKEGDRVFWSIADCTGHGVPGAVMSVIGNMLLNECTVVKKMTEPAEMLEEIKDVIVDTLQLPGEATKMYDGMDTVLCVINTRTYQLKFAGAKNPLYLVRKDAGQVDFEYDRKWSKKEYTLFEMKGDKQPVGFQPFKPEPFTQQEVQLKAGDVLYAFSDGYPDQFGGPRGKKFKYKQFRQLLLDIQGRSMQQQKQQLEDTIQQWMEEGREEQIDDICVGGLRIPDFEKT